jgi:hypothetical protein
MKVTYFYLSPRGDTLANEAARLTSTGIFGIGSGKYIRAQKFTVHGIYVMREEQDISPHPCKPPLANAARGPSLSVSFGVPGLAPRGRDRPTDEKRKPVSLYLIESFPRIMKYWLMILDELYRQTSIPVS